MGHNLCNFINLRLVLFCSLSIVAQLSFSDGYSTYTSPDTVQYGVDPTPQRQYYLEADISNYVVQVVQVQTSGVMFAMAAVFNSTSPVTVLLWRPKQTKYQVVWKMTVKPSSLNITEYIHIQSFVGQSCARVQNGDWVGLLSKANPFPIGRIFDTQTAIELPSSAWSQVKEPDLLQEVEFSTDTLKYPLIYQFAVFVMPTDLKTTVSPSTSPAMATGATVDGTNSSTNVATTPIGISLGTTGSSATTSSPSPFASVPCITGLVPNVTSPEQAVTTPFPVIVGVNGPIGPVGWTGNTGASGPEGLAGVVGVQGLPSNETGVIGPVGMTGPMGPQGDNNTIEGVQGINGSTGPDGDMGEAGIVGVTGFEGQTGPLGNNLTIFKFKDGHYDLTVTGQNTQFSFWQGDMAIKGIYIWLAIASFVALIAFVLIIVICCTDSRLKRTLTIDRRLGLIE